MRILIRLLPWILLIWLVCHFFYSLGKKKALEEKKKQAKDPHRKVVESTVVENQNKSDSKGYSNKNSSKG